ncbi:cytochrome b [Sphingomonas sp. M1-B02]|uniref:cytochrome b n=1 Tax=Sphingomonas sp. M1-B02 TaxID=3114300 RepID=UPI00223EBA50|nr:cytochrome b [Sphingomonas sp. S6-11]UZK65838.1 cytochrome b [Sphingomonas sp. S6-11]
MAQIHRNHYGAVAAAFHWGIALLLFAQIYVGWTFGDMERGPARGLWFDWHKTLGFVILILSLARLGWRLMNPPPPLPAEMKSWERIAARANHIAFYVILIGLPLTGWAYISTGSGALASSTTPLVGGLSFPFLPGLPREGHDTFEDAHVLLVKITYALVALHVAAVLKHLLIDKGPLARRMPPFTGLRG